MKYFDQHNHSEYSPDCKQPIRPYLDLIRKLGIKNFVLTDHYDINKDNEGHDFVSDFSAREIELNQIRKEYKDIHIMSGIEIGYKVETLQETLQFLDKFNFSLILLSVHYQKDIDYYLVDRFTKENVRDLMRDYFKAQIEAATIVPDYDIFCHIDYGFRTAHLVDPDIKISEFEDQLIELFKVLISRDKVFELNTKVQERVGSDEHTKYILDLYKKCGGVNICISSDSHHAERYLSSFEKYKQMVKDAGFDHLNYFIDRKRYEEKI